MTTDQQLLHQYSADGSKQALDDLIRRHMRLVYSSAVRQLRDPHLAEDVTQAVFMVLARKAATIRRQTAVAGWLLAVTRRASLDAMRRCRVRQRHERAAAMNDPIQATPDQWSEIAPMLDQTLEQLASKDRDVIVLRFFQDCSYLQVGQEIGATEEAARKRVTRALERLRRLFARHGVKMPAGVIGAAIAGYAVQAAPGHLSAASILAGTAGAAGSPSVSIAQGVMKMMAWTKAWLTAGIMAMLILAGGGIVFVGASRAQTPVPPRPSATVDANSATYFSTDLAAPSPPQTQPDVFTFIVTDQDQINLDLPLVSRLEMRMPQGLTRDRVQPWIAAMNRRQSQWLRLSGDDLCVALVRTEQADRSPLSANFWSLMTSDDAVVAEVTAENWDQPARETLKAAIDDWSAKNPKPSGPDQGRATIVQTPPPVPLYYAFQSNEGRIGIFCITRFDTSKPQAAATIEIKEVGSAVAQTQP